MWSLFKNDSKRLINIFVLLTGFYLLGYLLSGFSNTDSFVFARIIFYVICSVSIFAVILVNFKYLHEKTSATHMLSLPLTKLQICLTKYLSGLFIIVIPSMVFIIAFGLTTGASIATFMACALQFICIYYTLGCIVANLTGKAVMHIFVYIMVCFIPMLLYVSLSTTIAQYVYGMSSPDISMTIVQLLLPGSYLVLNSISIFYTLVFLGYSLGLFVLMLWIATVRPFEKTGEAVAFDKVDDVIKFLIIASFSWLLMSLIAISMSDSGAVLPIVCVFSTVIVTVIAELIFFKKIKILRALIQITSICVATIVIFFATSNYFQYRIPSTPKEASIHFNNYRSYGSGSDLMKSEHVETIAMIQEVHEYLATNPIISGEVGAVVEIYYTEDNNDSVRRSYQIDKNVYNKIKTIFNDNIDGYMTLMNGYYDSLAKELLQDDISGINVDSFDEQNLEIKEPDIKDLKQKLKIQFQRFKEHPELYQEINFADNTEIRGIYPYKEEDKMYSTYYIVYKNDPIYYALLDYKTELKAN